MAQQRVSTVLEVDASRAVSGFKAAENAAQQYAGGLEGVGRRASSVFDDVPGGLKLGTRVRHQKFGDGVVLGLEGQGSNARVQVNFERQGSKWLMLGYANLEVV